MKVRATQDGHYGGYYRSGPITTEQGTIDGVVFEISDEIFPILDIDGKKVLETNEEGKPEDGEAQVQDGKLVRAGVDGKDAKRYPHHLRPAQV